MDLTQYAVAAFALIGLVNGVQFAFTRQWDRFFYFLVAVVAGAVFGYFKMFSLPNVEIGILAGIASSGVYKTGQIIGGK
jgi:hypothetical protein